MVVGVYGSPTHCECAPLVHQPPTLRWQVRSCVGILDAISDIVSEAQLPLGVREGRSFRNPSPKPIAESVEGS